MPRCARCDHPHSAHEPGGPCLWSWSAPERGTNEMCSCGCDGYVPRYALQDVAQTTLEEHPLTALERQVEELERQNRALRAQLRMDQ